MRLNVPLTLLLTSLTTPTHALEEAHRNVDIFAWPLTAPAPSSLAKITYNTTHAAISNYASPKLSPEDSLVRIGFHPDTGDKDSWTGIATAAGNLVDDVQKTLTLHLNPSGQISHVGFKAERGGARSPKTGGKSADGGLAVEVVSIPPAPAPILNKPVVVKEDGSADGEEPEKSFFQKYWWALAGVLVLQLVLSGGGK
ncbi:hypothetical protein MBLNU230_g5362t1 [Neophaeotheca triangularis]